MEFLENEKLAKKVGRRGFFRNLLMFAGLLVSYGLAGSYALRYLFPGRKKKKPTKLFVGKVSEILAGQSKSFSTPEGESFLLTNTGKGPEPFIAFSSRCPHLGCKVGWQPEEHRFYCPCHGGVFNADGVATAGPPAKAGQSLKSCEVVVEGQAIYALVERV